MTASGYHLRVAIRSSVGFENTTRELDSVQESHLVVTLITPVDRLFL